MAAEAAGSGADSAAPQQQPAQPRSRLGNQRTASETFFTPAASLAQGLEAAGPGLQPAQLQVGSSGKHGDAGTGCC